MSKTEQKIGFAICTSQRVLEITKRYSCFIGHKYIPHTATGPRYFSARLAHRKLSALTANIQSSGSTLGVSGNGLPDIEEPVKRKGGSLDALNDILSGTCELARPLWEGDCKHMALLWAAGSIVLAFSSTLYAAGLSILQRTFWNCLSTKDIVQFKKLVVLYIVAVVVGPAVLSLFAWVKKRLALLWRDVLTRKFLNSYVAESNHYRLKFAADKVDNPDQRIAQDVAQFTKRAVDFFCVIGVGVFDLIVFSYLLYKVYSPLLLTIILYSVVGTGTIFLLGRRLVPLNRLQLTREADFRFGLVRVRECAESIAFYRGESAERNELKLRFESLLRNAKRLVGLERNVNFATNSYRYWAQIIPTVVVAPSFFRGDMPLGGISQTYFSFNHVLSSMGLVVTEFSALAEFAAGVRRLRQLSTAIDLMNVKLKASKFSSSKIFLSSEEQSPSTAVKLSGVSIQTPSDPPRELVQKLSISLENGKHLLVVGSSGVGKSSLLRAICGLWDDGSGTMNLPRKEDTLFLPQRPFITLGSLRQNVLYPSTNSSVTDDEIEKALEAVNLGYISERMGGLDAPGEQLEQKLSLGEQQRLAFARVLISKPRFLVGDEFTSALDLENERTLYALLRELNVTCISVGNRPSLLEFHDVVLHLRGGGKWDIETPKETSERISALLNTRWR